MAQVSLVMPADRSALTDELAATLSHELGRQDMPAVPASGAFPADQLGQVHLLMDPAGWLRETTEPPAETILRRTIVLVEEVPDPGEESLLELLTEAGAVFAPDPRRALAVNRLTDRQVRVLRAGYSEPLDHFDPDAERPVEVALIGGSDVDRAAVVAALPGRRCELVPAGESRLALLTRSRIAINLHDGECRQLEWRRVLDAVHCGAAVVSEHAGGIAPLVAGEHLLVGSRDALPYLAAVLLRDPDRLSAMRDAAYQRLRDWMPYALPVSVLRAAIVELVGEPAVA